MALTYGCFVSELRHQAGDCISLDCFSFIKKLGSGGEYCEISGRWCHVLRNTECRADRPGPGGRAGGRAGWRSVVERTAERARRVRSARLAAVLLQCQLYISRPVQRSGSLAFITSHMVVDHHHTPSVHRPEPSTARRPPPAARRPPSAEDSTRPVIG